MKKKHINNQRQSVKADQMKIVCQLYLYLGNLPISDTWVKIGRKKTQGKFLHYAHLSDSLVDEEDRPSCRHSYSSQYKIWADIYAQAATHTSTP